MKCKNKPKKKFKVKDSLAPTCECGNAKPMGWVFCKECHLRRIGISRGNTLSTEEMDELLDWADRQPESGSREILSQAEVRALIDAADYYGENVYGSGDEEEV